MRFKKKKDVETLIRLRSGNFELRLSNAKVEIEDVIYKTTKHVYSNVSYEYGLLSFLLKKQKAQEDGKLISKSNEEIEQGISNVNFLINMLAYTNLLFSNEDFRKKYLKLVTSMIAKSKPAVISKEEDEKILDEMKTEDEMSKSV